MNYERVPVLVPSLRLIALVAGIIIGLLAIGLVLAGPAQAGEGKVFVCKYVGTPGADERLQTGQNPISVSVNAIPDDAIVGSYFADAQGRSFVLAIDVGQPEPSASECPGQEEPSSEPSSQPSADPSVAPSPTPSATPGPTTPSATPTPTLSPSAPSAPQTDVAASDPAPDHGNPLWLAVAAVLSAVTASTILRRPNPARRNRR